MATVYSNTAKNKFFSRTGSETTMDAERRWLKAKGYNGTRTDMWNQHMTAKGYSGSHNQKWEQYLNAKNAPKGNRGARMAWFFNNVSAAGE